MDNDAYWVRRAQEIRARLPADDYRPFVEWLAASHYLIQIYEQSSDRILDIWMKRNYPEYLCLPEGM